MPIHVKHRCVCVCVCVRACVHVYVVYEDIFSVPIIQNAYKSNRVSFLGGKLGGKSPVRAKFRCRVGVGQ